MDPILKQTIIAAKKKRAAKVEEDEEFVRNWALGVDHVDNNIFKGEISRAIQAGENKVTISEYSIPTPYSPIKCQNRVKIAYDAIKELEGIKAEWQDKGIGPQFSIQWTDIDIDEE